MRTILTLISIFFFSQVNAYTLPQHPVKPYDCDMCDNLSHEDLQAQWKTPAIPLKQAASNIQKSYSYNKKVTAEQLKQGVTLPINAPGAVLRITPLQNKDIPALELKSTSTAFMSLKDASSLYSQDEAIDESLRIGSHQTMLQIKPELGFGNFIIKSKKIDAQKDASTYLINVYEKYSSIYLQVEPSALLYQYGDEFKTIISLKNNEHIYPLDEISASLVGPGSQVIPLKIEEIDHNKFQASAIMLSDVNPHGENWYIEVDASGKSDAKNIISRTGRAALSYSIPSASLINIKRVSSNPLILAATVEVANASRYVLQSVLYRKNAQGEAVPVETTQSAQWLKPGKHIIKFSFDNSAHLAEDTLSVGYLHLIDYGQMKLVYQYDSPIKISQMLD